jgi:hypothetical protein
MNNSPYLDRPLVPLAVALRSMLAETEAKIAAAEPTEKEGLQHRAKVLQSGLGPINNAALDLAAYRARLSDPSWPQANLSLRPIAVSSGTHR